MPDHNQRIRSALSRLRATSATAITSADQIAVASQIADTIRTIKATPGYEHLDGLPTDLRTFLNPAEPFDRDPAAIFMDHLAELATQVRTVNVLLELRKIKLVPQQFDGLEFRNTEVWPIGPGAKPPGRPVICVPATGTEPADMLLRARDRAEHTLRKLRLAMASKRTDPRMLRFSLAGSWAFEDGTNRGLWLPEDAALELDLTDPAWSQELPEASLLPVSAATPAQEQAGFALYWIDKASLSADPLDQTILAFNALEAILGNRAEGRKSNWLIYHRILLGAEVSGWWTSPKPLSEFYQNVRSYAVHGSVPKAIPSNSEAAVTR